MTTHNPFISYPKHEHWRRYCKNGQPANGTLARRLVDGTNHVVAYRRKLFGTKCVAISGIPAGASSATEHWHFAGHTGVGVAYLEASIILAKADNGTDPFVYMQAVPIAGGSTLTSNEFHYSVVDASADDYPDEFAYGTIRVAVDPDTLYRVALITNDYARPVACSVYEIGEVPVNTDNGAVDPRVHSGVNILDSQIEELMPAQTAIWRNNAGPVLQWCRDSVGTAPTRSTASYANLIAQSAGSTVDANSIGVRVNLQYHNTQAQADVPVLMVVRAQAEAVGEIGFDGANAVKVTDGTNEIEIAGIDDSTLWYSTTGTMPADDNQKWDIQLSALAGYEIRVDAVYVFEWQATPATATNENGFYLPATIAESTAIGGTLDHIWLMQAASSPIEDEQTAGTDADLSETGTLAYQQSISGWSRYFVNLSDAVHEWLATGTDPADVTTTSLVMMVLAKIGTSTKNSGLIFAGSGGSLIAIITAASGATTPGAARLAINGTTYDGSYVYEDDGEAHMFSLEVDHRGGKDIRLKTDEETIDGAWDAGIGNLGGKRFGSFGSATGALECWIGWGGAAADTNAEDLIDAGSITTYTV